MRPCFTLFFELNVALLFSGENILQTALLSIAYLFTKQNYCFTGQFVYVLKPSMKSYPQWRKRDWWGHSDYSLSTEMSPTLERRDFHSTSASTRNTVYYI